MDKSGLKGEWIAILEFGSQYSQLIARRIRELHVYCELAAFSTPAQEIARSRPAGIVLSGGPASVFEKGAPACDPGIFDLGIPVLGICYGLQLIAQALGGKVTAGKAREYGHAVIRTEGANPIFHGLPRNLDVWMSHGDRVVRVPPGFRILAGTATCRAAAIGDDKRRIYGLQFHPEVAHTPRGIDILRRFVRDICGCRGGWRMADFARETVDNIRREVGNGKVVCGLSGGVDSSVTAALVHRAIGDRLHCIFVDNGLLRRGEAEEVERTFGRNFGINLKVARAGRVFLKNLRGITDPEAKRKIIGKTFIDVFSQQTRRLGEIEYLAQGTLYPDVIESSPPKGGPSATIKSHHNVGGLPPDLKFKLVEPLKWLFKDEVRELGKSLGLPDEIINRQPFPGPGLAVRIIGQVTPERVRLLQEADARVQEEIRKLRDYGKIWQSFAVLLPVHTVGVMGDSRTYENVVALRVVSSSDGMTADWFRVPYDTLARISNRIINEVRGINRVVFDISSKPPATIEWE